LDCIAARLRSETTLPLKWIVARVQTGTAIGATSVPHHLAQKLSSHAPSSNSNLRFDPAFVSGTLPVLRFQLSESQLFSFSAY
jgi:hypothetical protein